MWMTIAIFGALPKGRTSHCMSAIGNDQIIIYGGNDLKAFCESTSLQMFDFGNNHNSKRFRCEETFKQPKLHEEGPR